MGIEANVVGLAVAVKPSAETYAKFKSGELTGFSIAGTGIREPLEKAKSPLGLHLHHGRSSVIKATLYTDEQMGHQHTVSHLTSDGYRSGSRTRRWKAPRTRTRTAACSRTAR
jgi:hypothetical protein